MEVCQAKNMRAWLAGAEGEGGLPGPGAKKLHLDGKSGGRPWGGKAVGHQGLGGHGGVPAGGPGGGRVPAGVQPPGDRLYDELPPKGVGEESLGGGSHRKGFTAQGGVGQEVALVVPPRPNILLPCTAPEHEALALLPVFGEQLEGSLPGRATGHLQGVGHCCQVCRVALAVQLVEPGSQPGGRVIQGGADPGLKAGLKEGFSNI